MRLEESKNHEGRNMAGYVHMLLSIPPQGRYDNRTFLWLPLFEGSFYYAQACRTGSVVEKTARKTVGFDA